MRVTSGSAERRFTCMSQFLAECAVQAAEAQLAAHRQNVVNQFMALGRDPRVAFLGNVAVGQDVPLQDLRSYYNAASSCLRNHKSRLCNLACKITLQYMWVRLKSAVRHMEG